MRLITPPLRPPRLQVIDDLLDFTGTSDTLGKPGLQDMALGLSTAPVLYAIDEHPQLKALVTRKFSEPGDVQSACELVTTPAAPEEQTSPHAWPHTRDRQPSPSP